MMHPGLLVPCLIVVGLFVSWIVSKILNKIENAKGFKDLKVYELVNGMIEVFMYTSSILLHAPEFIILWIGVKTALRWFNKITINRPISWDTDQRSTDKAQNFDNKKTYLKFLIGNSLNVICSYFVACLITQSIISFPGK